jgi:enamine deaminase RidA (YjgF/YER057c/UK114 family)
MAGMIRRRNIASSGPWEDLFGYSRAVRVGDLVFVAGTTAADGRGGAVGGADVQAQTTEALRRVAAALTQAGAELRHVVRTRIYLTDVTTWPAAARAHAEVFAQIRPAATMVVVAALIDACLLVEIEADAVIDAT